MVEIGFIAHFKTRDGFGIRGIQFGREPTVTRDNSLTVKALLL